MRDKAKNTKKVTLALRERERELGLQESLERKMHRESGRLSEEIRERVSRERAREFLERASRERVSRESGVMSE